MITTHCVNAGGSPIVGQASRLSLPRQGIGYRQNARPTSKIARRPANLLIGLFLAMLFGACGSNGAQSPPSSPRAVGAPFDAAELGRLARKTREDLTKAYQKSFLSFDQNDDARLELHLSEACRILAYRLWVPDPKGPDETKLRFLARRVVTRDLVVDKSGGAAETMPVAYFEDKDQPRRDEYAMVLSEAGVGKLGDTPIHIFAYTAMTDHGAGVLNTGAALPWTLTLVGRWFPIEQRTKNLAGKEIGLDDLVKELLAEPFLSPARGRFDEYDYQGIYALAVVTSRGVAQYEPEARKRMRAALDHWEKIDAESNGGPDAAGEAAGRVKINGILLGALFRGKPDLFPVTEFGADAQRLVEHLARDHQQYLMPLGADQSGILTSIPIAIHGLDLAEKALQPN